MLITMFLWHKKLLEMPILYLSSFFKKHPQQVMLDTDLANIYQVETRVMNQAVKRNIDRFPPEFMFQLTKEEHESLRSQIAALNLKSQIVTSSWGGRRKLPYAFTEHGVIMLSSVLNSKIATHINISVVRAFIEMQRYIAKPVREKLENLEKVLMVAYRRHKPQFFQTSGNN